MFLGFPLIPANKMQPLGCIFCFCGQARVEVARSAAFANLNPIVFDNHKTSDILLLMNNELAPQEYRHKHPKRIYLDTYRGMARDIMELNHPIADRFMQTSDIRADIAIVQQRQEVTRDYEEIGDVRIAKLLQIPRLNMHDENNFQQTKKYNDTWYISVNDQELAQNVARAGTGKNDFDDRYVQAFDQEVTKGMKAILRKEKLLNGGEYNFAFLVSYLTLVTKDLVLLPIIELEILLRSSNAEEVARGTAIVLAAYASIHGMFNLFNLFSVGLGKVRERFLLADNSFPSYPSYEDPFIRHTILEYVLPTVPFDRLFRGLKYLDEHGSDMITTGQTVNREK